MKTTDFLKEGIGDDAHNMHKDHEVQLARQDCYNAAKNAIELHKLLKNISEMQGLDGWVSEKITLAADYLKTVRDYLEYEMMSKAEELPAFNLEDATQTLDAALDQVMVKEDEETVKYLADLYADLYYGDFSQTLKIKQAQSIRDRIMRGELSVADLKLAIADLEKEQGLKESIEEDADLQEVKAKEIMPNGNGAGEDFTLKLRKIKDKIKKYEDIIKQHSDGMTARVADAIAKRDRLVKQKEKLEKLGVKESASAGASSAGSVAAVSTPLMKKIIKRKSK